MADEISDAIETNATGPKSVTVDGNSVTQHSISEQIKAAKYKASAAAVQLSHRGLRFTKIVPPGV